jgi:hypothetical protein
MGSIEQKSKQYSTFYIWQGTKDQRPSSIEQKSKQYSTFYILQRTKDQRQSSIEQKSKQYSTFIFHRGPRTRDRGYRSMIGSHELESIGRTIWTRWIQGPKTKDQIHFKIWDRQYREDKSLDQRPRNRSISVPFQWTKWLRPKSSRPKTKYQIQFSSFTMNKMTSSEKQQTKDQGPDLIQFFFKEEIDFFSEASDQRLRTRSNSVPFHQQNDLFLKAAD